MRTIFKVTLWAAVALNAAVVVAAIHTAWSDRRERHNIRHAQDLAAANTADDMILWDRQFSA